MVVVEKVIVMVIPALVAVAAPAILVHLTIALHPAMILAKIMSSGSLMTPEFMTSSWVRVNTVI
jgi:hypothetical protein